MFADAGTALAAIVIGGASGGALLCLVLAATHGMPRGTDTPFARLAIGAGAAGLALAAVTGFVLARPLGVWRSAVSSMVAVAGTALVGVLTPVADMLGGTFGLLVLAVLCVAFIAVAWRLRTTRNAA